MPRLTRLVLTAATLAFPCALAIHTLASDAAGNRYHQRSHRWRFPHSVPLFQRYRIIAGHDRWVISTRKSHPAWIVRRHRRELRHALAHIRRLRGPVPLSGWTTTDVTTYSWTEGGTHGTGCGGWLEDGDLTFAARDYQVGCGGKIQFCFHGRCAVGTRTDSSGPGVAPYSFDLNYGLAVALGLPEIAHGSYPGGHAIVRWRLVR